VGYPEEDVSRRSRREAAVRSRTSMIRHLLAPLLLAAGLTGQVGAAAQERFQPSLCPSLGWAEQERIPIFDPLADPDATASRDLLGRLDTEIRSQVEEELRKKGWKLVSRSEAACLMRYSLIQELDLEVARRGAGGSIPGDPLGASLPSTGTDSHLRKQGTFTLDVLVGDPEDRIWQGTQKAPLGRGREVERNIRRLVREVLRQVPRTR
jgi:hypothetical protein